MTKNKGGRPTIVLTDEQINEIPELAKHHTIEQIADYFGISETTFYEIKNRNSEVSTAYKKGKASGIKEASGLLWGKMKNGDTTAIIFYLKTQAGWRERQEIDVTTKDVTSRLPDIVIRPQASYEQELLKRVGNESSK